MEHLEIVSHHHKEDMTWLVSQKEYPYKIYSSNPSAIIPSRSSMPPNTFHTCLDGPYEVPAYIQYIIDNYDNLPKWVAFIHGHERCYHQSDSILESITLWEGQSFFSLNNRYVNGAYHKVEFENAKEIYRLFEKNNRGYISMDYTNASKLWDNRMNRNYLHTIRLWEELQIDKDIPTKWEFTAHAQFIVERSIITSYPLSFYQRAMDLMRDVDWVNSYSGPWWVAFAWEYLWPLIFTNGIEPTRKYWFFNDKVEGDSMRGKGAE